MLIDSKYRIITTDGYQTDENDSLVEVVIPSTVKTYQSPAKITFLGETINWVPSTAAALQEFEAPNTTALFSANFANFTALTTINFPKLLSMGSSVSSSMFYKCTALANIIMPELTAISCQANNGLFFQCNSLVSVTFPKVQTVVTYNVPNSYSPIFCQCAGLTTLNFPCLKSITVENRNAAAIRNCASLTNVTFGTVGNPVQSLSDYVFSEMTQSGLTITVYTAGGASLANSPWGATNATIVYEEA